MEGIDRELSYEMLARALFENYESIYDIDLETSRYRSYHESRFYRELEIEKEGPDFFASLKVNIPKIICREDQAYVQRMLEREALLEGVRREKYYSLIYRIQKGELQLYHQIRATLQTVRGKTHVLMGVRNVDAMMRREMAHRDEITDMRQKEQNHMEAILASAAACMEANLTADHVIEQSPDYPSEQRHALIELPAPDFSRKYSVLHEWISDHLILANADRYREIGSINYLLGCFARGEKRASVSFSVRTSTGDIQPCREVFYLYRESSTGDVHVFCVIYDLTEQQRKEQEMEELEEALRMSRIHNFTSQMQPHFLYNALGSIQEIVLTNPAYAADLIGDFTVHLRSCIRAMSCDEPLPFAQELGNIRAYVNIASMRFGDKLRVQYEIGTEAFRILPLSIQPLVENAIRHGIYERGLAGGRVIIRTRKAESGVCIEVEDDGVGFDVDAFRENRLENGRDSTGLRNIIFRLDKVMHATVELQSRPGQGTLVTVFVPEEGVPDAGNRCR